MDLVLNNLKIPIEQDGASAWLKAAADKLGLGEADITIVKFLSKALDIRNQEQFYYTISLVVSVADSYDNKQKFQAYFPDVCSEKKAPKLKERPLVVGFGPAGMFAALELIDYGLKPIIFERGKKVDERSIDVKRFIDKRELNPESNIQFGEGGAGTYSDGKLFSRRNQNTSYVNRVLKTFVKFGAPAEIEYISKPHLGTDVIRKIVRNIRHHILEQGGDIHYSAKMTDLLIRKGRACGLIINGEKEFLASKIFLALGHSSRDTYEMLHKKGVALEQRPISVGVRIEHPVETINRMRYGDKYVDFPGLGAAAYSLNYTNKRVKKGVYTFCMCPGGEVVNASSEQGLLVLNGMSYSKRSSSFSNGALVASCHTTDYPSTGPLAGLEFQKKIEQRAFAAGGSSWQAPAQNLLHFLGKQTRTDLPQTSFKMGVVHADLKEIFPAFVTEHLLEAFAAWKNEVPLFVSGEALLLAAETRTSSPVRISRNEHYQSINTEGLTPIGEGSGYTGGITSSAADAIRAVEKQLAVV